MVAKERVPGGEPAEGKHAFAKFMVRRPAGMDFPHLLPTFVYFAEYARWVARLASDTPHRKVRTEFSSLRSFTKFSLPVLPMLPKGADQKELNLCHEEASRAPTQSSESVRFPATGSGTNHLGSYDADKGHEIRVGEHDSYSVDDETTSE